MDDHHEDNNLDDEPFEENENQVSKIASDA